MARLAFKVFKKMGVDMSLAAFFESFLRIGWLTVFVTEFIAVGAICVYFKNLPSPWNMFVLVGAFTFFVSMTIGWLYDLREWGEQK